MTPKQRQQGVFHEAMARALFQSWFVDFDPVRAKLDGRAPFGIGEATLATLRDTLLPKLLSGELSVIASETCPV